MRIFCKQFYEFLKNYNNIFHYILITHFNIVLSQKKLPTPIIVNV